MIVSRRKTRLPANPFPNDTMKKVHASYSNTWKVALTVDSVIRSSSRRIRALARVIGQLALVVIITVTFGGVGLTAFLGVLCAAIVAAIIAKMQTRGRPLTWVEVQDAMYLVMSILLAMVTP